ncbi:hypothetical protein KSP40_PGU016664 [Platanthera guangdongensis]|uniref:Uncharacterized protein n=1 Tax=Platanthera guangdongensis TaxID=2320717 RepID=A0ABR2N3Q9_9ASPA
MNEQGDFITNKENLKDVTNISLDIRWGIKQFFVAVEKEEGKFGALCDLYDTLTIRKAVIFCNTKKGAVVGELIRRYTPRGWLKSEDATDGGLDLGRGRTGSEKWGFGGIFVALGRDLGD